MKNSSFIYGDGQKRLNCFKNCTRIFHSFCPGIENLEHPFWTPWIQTQKLPIPCIYFCFAPPPLPRPFFPYPPPFQVWLNILINKVTALLRRGSWQFGEEEKRRKKLNFLVTVMTLYYFLPMNPKASVALAMGVVQTQWSQWKPDLSEEHHTTYSTPM